MTNTVTDTLTGIDALLERYLAIYNETDPAKRRADIEALWTPDAVLANASMMYRGHNEIAVGVGRSHDQWVGSGHEFRPGGITSVHHNTARFVWHMHLGDHPEPVAKGTNFMVFTIDGRLASDYQFNDK